MGMIDGVVTLAVEGCSMGGNIRPGLGRNDPVGWELGNNYLNRRHRSC
jgi:hypothetical protein